MSKLRLWTDRRENNEQEPADTDLRGLSVDHLLKESVNFGHLTLTHMPSDEIQKDVEHRFGLHPYQDTHQKSTHHHYVVNTHMDGQFKVHSVILFSAFLYLHQKHPEVGAHLCTISGLHWSLEKGMEGAEHSHSPSAEISQWKAEKGSLHINEHTCHHLIQAGFPLKHTEFLNTTELDTCYHHLMGTKHQHLKKVA